MRIAILIEKHILYIHHTWPIHIYIYTHGFLLISKPTKYTFFHIFTFFLFKKKTSTKKSGKPKIQIRSFHSAFPTEGTLRAFALLGAFLALMLALMLGPAPLDLPDDVADVCEAVAWFRDTELSYTVASTESLKAWAQVAQAFFC